MRSAAGEIPCSPIRPGSCLRTEVNAASATSPKPRRYSSRTARWSRFRTALNAAFTRRHMEPRCTFVALRSQGRLVGYRAAMPALLLVRHGQALDPMHGDYDGLSLLGESQARSIGAALKDVA